MKKTVWMFLITAVILIVGCRTGMDTIPSVQESIDDPNQFAVVNLRFDWFGNPNQNMTKRNRETQDLITLISRAQEKKVSYIKGHLFSVHESNTYSFRIDKNNQNGNIRVKVGEYNIYAYAYGVIENNTYKLFDGNRKFEANKKGPDNECLMTLLLNVNQPIVIDLPEDETVSKCFEMDYKRKNIKNIEFSSDFCPSPDGRRISGAVATDIEEMTVLYKDRIYNLNSDIIIDALLFDEIIVLDEYDSESATFIKMEFETEGSKLIAGSTQNTVLMFKIKATQYDIEISSFPFDLDGQDSDVEKITLIQENSDGNIELGHDSFENNISTINPSSPVEIPNGEEITFILEACIPASATIGNSISFKLNGSNLPGPFEIKQVNPEFTIILNGTLTVDVVGNLASTIVTAESTGNDAAYFEFIAQNESIDLEQFTINIINDNYTCTEMGDYKDIAMASVYDGDTLLTKFSIPSTNSYTVNFSPGTFVIPIIPRHSLQKELTVKIDMSAIDPDMNDAPGTANASIKIGISDIKARGLKSKNYVTIIERKTEGRWMVLYNSNPYIKSSCSKYFPSPNPRGAADSLINGNLCIYGIEATASTIGKDVLIYKLTVETKISNQEIKLSNPYIIDENANIISESEWTLSDEGYITSFYFDNPNFESGLKKEAINISAGQSKKFNVYTTVSGASIDSYIATHLVKDNDCSPINTAEEVEGNFIWSDNHKELSISSQNNNVVDAEQWYNGMFLYPSFNYFGWYYISY